MNASTHSLDLRAVRMNETPKDEILQSELARLKAHLLRHHGAMAGGSAGVSDVAQEAAYRVLQRGESVEFESPLALRRYLWLTAKRLIVDRFRRKVQRGPVLGVDSLASELPAGDAVMIPEGGEPGLLRALHRLTFEDRRLLELAYMHEASVGEIARELGIKEAAVRMRLVRARDRLRERLAVPGDQGPRGSGTRNV